MVLDRQGQRQLKGFRKYLCLEVGQYKLGKKMHLAHKHNTINHVTLFLNFETLNSNRLLRGERVEIFFKSF